MRTFSAWIVWSLLTFASCPCHAQGTVELRFDDLPSSVPVGNQYGQFGVHFGSGDAGVFPGLSNGDLGHWGLDGTAGQYFDGFNGHPDDSMRLTFDTPITSFSLDASRANGSQDQTYFSLQAYQGHSLVGSVGQFLGSVNQWTTFSVSGAAIDSIQFSAMGIGRGEGGLPLNYVGVFGIDNVRFTTVPEPSILTPFMATGFLILLARTGRRCESLPNEITGANTGGPTAVAGTDALGRPPRSGLALEV